MVTPFQVVSGATTVAGRIATTPAVVAVSVTRR